MDKVRLGRILGQGARQAARTAWDAIDRRDWAALRPLLHPHLHWHDRDVELRGRTQVMTHLQDHPTPRPPTEVEVRDEQVYRWTRAPVQAR